MHVKHVKRGCQASQAQRTGRACRGRRGRNGPAGIDDVNHIIYCYRRLCDVRCQYNLCVCVCACACARARASVSFSVFSLPSSWKSINIGVNGVYATMLAWCYAIMAAWSLHNHACAPSPTLVVFTPPCLRPLSHSLLARTQTRRRMQIRRQTQRQRQTAQLDG